MPFFSVTSQAPFITVKHLTTQTGQQSIYLQTLTVVMLWSPLTVVQNHVSVASNAAILTSASHLTL